MHKVSLGIIALLCTASVAGCAPREWDDARQAMYQQTVTYFNPPHYVDHTPALAADDAEVVGQ